MPTNADLETAKFEEFNKISMLKKATQQTRDQHFAFFKDYLASKQEMDMVELLSCQGPGGEERDCQDPLCLLLHPQSP